MQTIKLNLDIINIVFLAMFLFGFSIQGLTFFKYIGLYGSIFIFIIRIFKEKDIIESFKSYYNEYKNLIIWLFLFIFSVILSIIFVFSDVSESLKEFRVQFLNILYLLLILLFQIKKFQLKH